MKDNPYLSNELKKAVILRNDLEETLSIDTEKGYRKTMNKIRKEERRRRWIIPFQRIASVLLLPFVLSTFFLTWLYYNKEEIKIAPMSYTEITAAPGTIVETILPDQSIVWLNAGSKLRYPQQFMDSIRPVELSGEAFFQVKTNSSVPFEVMLACGLKVIATGTSFNISSYDDDSFQEIVLEEGIVEVVNNNDNYLLSPGESALWDKINREFTFSSVTLYEKIAWKDGLLIFRNSPLDEVLRRLSRRYNVNINFTPVEQNYNIRATFSTESVYQILDYLQVITPLEWSVKEIRQNQDTTFPRQEINVWMK